MDFVHFLYGETNVITSPFIMHRFPHKIYGYRIHYYPVRDLFSILSSLGYILCVCTRVLFFIPWGT